MHLLIPMTLFHSFKKCLCTSALIFLKHKQAVSKLWVIPMSLSFDLADIRFGIRFQKLWVSLDDWQYRVAHDMLVFEQTAQPVLWEAAEDPKSKSHWQGPGEGVTRTKLLPWSPRSYKVTGGLPLCHFLIPSSTEQSDITSASSEDQPIMHRMNSHFNYTHRRNYLDQKLSLVCTKRQATRENKWQPEVYSSHQDIPQETLKSSHKFVFSWDLCYLTFILITYECKRTMWNLAITISITF